MSYLLLILSYHLLLCDLKVSIFKIPVVSLEQNRERTRMTMKTIDSQSIGPQRRRASNKVNAFPAIVCYSSFKKFFERQKSIDFLPPVQRW